MSDSPAAPKPSVPQGGKGANPMRAPYVEKVVVNIGVGEAGDRLVKAEQVLQMVTKQKPVRTLSKTTSKDLGLRVGMPIGVKVTMRGAKALEFLKTALWTKENQLPVYSFDREGNFSFGVAEYTDFPGQKYNPDIGVFGLDVCVTLSRKGIRLQHRTARTQRVPRRHRLTREEGRAWVAQTFSVTYFGEE